METAFRCRLRGPLAHYQHGKLDPEHLYINLHILHTLLYKFLKYHLGESFNKASWVGDRFFYSHDRNALFISISAGRNEKLIRVWRVHQSRYRISSLSYFLVPSSRHSRTKPLSFTLSHKQLQCTFSSRYFLHNFIALMEVVTAFCKVFQQLESLGSCAYERN